MTVGDSVLTSKPTVLLVPSPMPRPLTSTALAVNECFPAGSEGLTGPAVQMPPDAVVVAFATSVVPRKTWTVTVVGSLAVPENEGIVAFDGVSGWAIVTAGGSVLTSKNTEPLLPSGFSTPLFAVAKAV